MFQKRQVFCKVKWKTTTFFKISLSLSEASGNIKSYSLSDYDYKILKELKTVDTDLKKEASQNNETSEFLGDNPLHAEEQNNGK